MRLAALFGAQKTTRSMTESSRRKVLPESFKGVSLKKKDDSSWLKYTLVLVAITLPLRPL